MYTDVRIADYSMLAIQAALKYLSLSPGHSMNNITVTVGEKFFDFESFEQWVNKASLWYYTRTNGTSHCLSVDSVGRICLTGKEFMRARDEGSFPISVYAARNDK